MPSARIFRWFGVITGLALQMSRRPTVEHWPHTSMAEHAGSPAPEGGAIDLVIVIPIYNDWDAVSLLLSQVDRVLAVAELHARVLLVDDGSESPGQESFEPGVYTAIDGVDVLVLRRNVGHQRAIGIGLTYVYERMRPERVLVMDGDGEDDPADVPRLLAALDASGRRAVVFAERRRRSEGMVFTAFYALYRYAHWLLTGIPVRVGNFSAVPASQLQRLVVVSELWNHYAAGVFTARLPRTTVPTRRAVRLRGRSRMNFVSLVAHGLSALSVHAELIGVRLLVVTLLFGGLVLAALSVVVGLRLFTDLAVPAWAAAGAGILLLLLVQTVAFAFLFAFLVLHGRSQPSFVPLRDYAYFVSDVLVVFPQSRVGGHERVHVPGS